MIAIIGKMLREAGVYWAPAGRDQFGRPVFADPVQVRCRWEDKSEEYIDPQGDTCKSSARIFVDQDVERGGMLMLGSLNNVNLLVAPAANGALEIKSFTKSTNLNRTQFLRMVLV